MKDHTDKTLAVKNHSPANEIVIKQSDDKSLFQLSDNRAVTTAQLKLHKMAKSSSQSKQVAQLQDMADKFSARDHQLMQKKENNTGLPDNLKSGMEQLSGQSLDHVKVHYNSKKPAALQAHAYAQGSVIHLASGQEKHLPHELGHVVQQTQGRVKPTTSVGGMSVNDDASLESEATVMGEKALQCKVIVDKHDFK